METIDKKNTSCTGDFTVGVGNAEVTPENVRLFREAVSEMARVYELKNHDYGDSYAKSVGELGIVAGVAPIYNKCNRLVQLAKGEAPMVAGEALEDTLLDLASYCVMLKIALREGE